MCCRFVSLAVVVATLVCVLFGALPVRGAKYVAEFLLCGASAILGAVGMAAWAAVMALLVVLFLGLFAAALALFLGWGAQWLERRCDLIGRVLREIEDLPLFDGEDDSYVMLLTLLHLLDVLVLRETLMRLVMFSSELLDDSPLIFMCAFPHTSPGLVELALRWGKNINEIQEGATPLDTAIQAENVPVVWTLLRHGAIRHTEAVPKLGAPAPQ